MGGNIVDESDIEYVEESYVDEFGNVKTRMVPKIKDSSLKRMQKDADGSKNAPKSNNLTPRTITATDANGNKIQKSVLVDDQGNIVDDDDIEYVEETYTDEFGNQRTRQVPKIKDNSLRRMQKEANDIGSKKAPQSNKLTPRIITTTDANGNKIQKSVLVDDQGNIVDEDDIE